MRQAIPKRFQRFHDLSGTFDCAPGTVEGRQEPIARRVDFRAPIPCQIAADRRMMHVQEIGEAQIALRHRHLGRAGNVGEHQGRNPTFGYYRGGAAGQEGLDVVNEFI